MSLNNQSLSHTIEDRLDKQIREGSCDMWEITDPEKIPLDPVTGKLIEKLSPKSTIFEYGCGRGKNILPLIDLGHRVYAQDVWGTAVEDIKKRIQKTGKQAHLFRGKAEEHIHEIQYDAMMCLRMLHFLENMDAMIVIGNMMKYTKPGGYNVHSLFLSQTKHFPQFYFPDVDIFINLYTSHGWTIEAQSKICEDKLYNENDDRIFYQKSILFRKPQKNTEDAIESNQEYVNDIISGLK